MQDREAAVRLFRHARREAMTVLVVWAAALTWTVGYCYLFGYEHGPDSWVVQIGLVSAWSPERLRMVAGLPDWVAFGIVLPWLCCTLFTIVFGSIGMPDDDLGNDPEEDAGHGH